MVLNDLELGYRDLFHSISEHCNVRSISEAQMLQLRLHEDIYIINKLCVSFEATLFV